MNLNAADKPLPAPTEVSSIKPRENVFTRGLRKFLGTKATSVQFPNVTTNLEQSLTTWQEREEVPLIEVAGIIRQTGNKIAQGLYTRYENSFNASFDLEDRFEDKGNNVQLRKDGNCRHISVFIVPPDNQDSGYALEGQPKVMFEYKRNESGEWSYDGATVHGGGGYIDAYSPVATEKIDRGHSGHFWNHRVKVSDLERALTKYLPLTEPNQTSTHTTLLKPGK